VPSCDRRAAARRPWFGLKFNAVTARWTRARVRGDTLASSLITRETVLVPTPARAATSRMVGRTFVVDLEGGFDIDVPSPSHSLSICEFVNLLCLTPKLRMT
jgi:hypothetical protein